jgi:hypothetical protein
MSRRKKGSGKMSSRPRKNSMPAPSAKTPSESPLPATAPRRWRIALALFVLIASGTAFSWVELYGEHPMLPLIKSFSIQSDCTNDKGILGLLVNGEARAQLSVGLTGPVTCSEIRISTPGLASDILSVVPRSVAPSGRQAIPPDAIRVTEDETYGVSISLSPDKLSKPSGMVSLIAPMTRTSFDTYTALFPVTFPKTDGPLHPPKSIQFSTLISTGLNVVILRPSTVNLKESVSGEHFAALEIVKDEEIYLEVQSIRLKQIKNLVQWVAGTFFGVAVAYLLALIGLRV